MQKDSNLKGKETKTRANKPRYFKKDRAIPPTISWFKHYGRKFGHCESCGYRYNLTLHHGDGNSNNNNVSNFVLLCNKKEYLFGLITVKGCHPKVEKLKGNDYDWRAQQVIRGTEKPQTIFKRLFLLLKRKIGDDHGKKQD